MHDEHDLKLAEAIAAHPAVGKFGDGTFINALANAIKVLGPILIPIIQQFLHANPPSPPTPANP